MTVRLIAMAAAAAAALGAAAAAQTPNAAAPQAMPQPIRGELVDTGGQTVGEVMVSEAGSGLLIRVHAYGLPPGPHGMHLHTVGECDSLSGFTSAGDHIAGPEETHGLRSDGEPHDGDLPNLIIGEDGMATAEFETRRIPLRGAHSPLLDRDGSALVVHADEDDHMSEDGGASGARIACAVLEESDETAPSSAE